MIEFILGMLSGFIIYAVADYFTRGADIPLHNAPAPSMRQQLFCTHDFECQGDPLQNGFIPTFKCRKCGKVEGLK